MIVVVLLAGAVVLFAAGAAAGRYASWLGLVVPATLTYVLGVGWDWDPDAIPFVVIAGVVSAAGWFFGLWRRRTARRVPTGA